MPKIKVSKYKNTVQLGVPGIVLRDMGLLPGDVIEFKIVDNTIVGKVHSKARLDEALATMFTNKKTKEGR